MSISQPQFLVLQHAACETLGIHEQQLAEYGASIHRVEVDAGEPFPASGFGYAGIIVMGGPMGAYETDVYPWLRPEIHLLRNAVEADVPVWGVCLGAQLLAAAMGAEVMPGEAGPEVGVMNVYGSTPAAHDPVFEPAAPEFTVLQWHGDTYELPDDAVRLASSHAFPQQAFRIRNAYGLQFHLEATPELVAQWGELPEYSSGLESAHGSGAMAALLAAYEAAAPSINALGRQLFTRWLERVVGLSPVQVVDDDDDDAVSSDRRSTIY